MRNSHIKLPLNVSPFQYPGPSITSQGDGPLPASLMQCRHGFWYLVFLLQRKNLRPRVQECRGQGHTTGYRRGSLPSVPFLLASSSSLNPPGALSLCHREQPLQERGCQGIKANKGERASRVGPHVLLGEPDLISSPIVKTFVVLSIPAAGACSTTQ